MTRQPQLARRRAPERRRPPLLLGAHPLGHRLPHRLHGGEPRCAQGLGGDAVDVRGSQRLVVAHLGEETALGETVEQRGGLLATMVLDERPGRLAEVGDDGEDLQLLGRGGAHLLDVGEGADRRLGAAQGEEADPGAVVGQREANLLEAPGGAVEVLPDGGDGDVQGAGEVGEGDVTGDEERSAEQ